MTKNISFIIFTFNEEKRIELLVRNLRPYGEVFLLDGGSTDRTKEIAESFGAKFVVRPKSEKVQVETQEMLEFAKTLIRTEWIFWSYVDNFLPKTLLEEITKISQENKYSYVYVPIDTYLWGESQVPVISASYSCFFKKDKVNFGENRIHGMGKFTGPKEEILHLPKNKDFSMRHYSLYDLTKFVSGHVRYASAEAEERFKDGKRFSIYYMFGSMARYFWLFYKKGWRAGVRGVYGALLYSFFRLMMAVRLYELEHGVNLETIEQEYQKEKLKIVKEVEIQ